MRGKYASTLGDNAALGLRCVANAKTRCPSSSGGRATSGRVPSGRKRRAKSLKMYFVCGGTAGPGKCLKLYIFVYFCIFLYIFVLLGQKSPHAFLSGKKAHVASWQSLGLGGGEGEGGGEDGGWSPNGPPKRRRHETSHHEARRRKADNHTPQCNQENPQMIIHVLPDWRGTRFRRLRGLCGEKSKDDKNTRNEIQKS